MKTEGNKLTGRKCGRFGAYLCNVCMFTIITILMTHVNILMLIIRKTNHSPMYFPKLSLLSFACELHYYFIKSDLIHSQLC